MNQTNYQLIDFLEFDPGFQQDEFLWKACFPTSIEERDGKIVVTIPFQRQLQAVDIQPDLDMPRKSYDLVISAYGEKILKLSIGFEKALTEESEMLQLDPQLVANPLTYEIITDQWIIKDQSEITRAIFDFSQPKIDYWSNLLPEPHETLKLSVFPDGKKEIKVSAFDQFFPARNDAMALAFVEKDGQPVRATFSLEANPDEVFVGTGERFSKMDLSGKTFQLKNQDGQGVNSRRTYKNIPFYLSSEGYGLFLHTSAYSKFSLADHSTRSAQLLVEYPELDVFLIGGDEPAEIIRGYQQLTGFPNMPPLWSFGIWMSRMTYFSADEVQTICDRLREEKYPCDVIHLDTGWFVTDWLCEWKFNPERFSDPASFISKLKADGYRVSLWQMPYIAKEALQHDEAVANNYIGPLLESREQGGSNFSALDYAGTIDFTYPKAVDWYKGLLKELLEMGVVCIKTDFGEEIHMDAQYHDMDPKLLNNLYALLYQKAAYEITEEVAGEGIVWARAGWAGCQRYPLHWGGDAACSWDGMAGSLKGGLHLGLSGFGFWSHDVPGFHGVPDFMNSVISDELYVRWTQFGVFSSHIRYHGTSKREPYEYPNIANTVRNWWDLRYALIPYILQEGEKATHTGMPVLRALIFHHQDDRQCWHIDDLYYFGDDFLVAPVMNDRGIRDVYLPEGDWVNFFTGEEQMGGKWLKGFKTELHDMPVWVRKGASIPYYPNRVNCTDDMDLSKTIKLEINQSFKGIWKVLNIQ
ncbi:alpha-xylosidase [Marinoscillum sp. MHG1-6]|uniref:glycoside hydrolase family 31 protein n=1 Tax=Marinoscillum sp. MHG1-6 TaxID=2959627 RepID=UPI00215762FB|nr:alpha-xylosidase [Marinoscillum sp. MHG1-6]